MSIKRAAPYSGHRYTAAVIAHAVWLYFRFPLSLLMVEEMLAERGVVVSHKTIRRWGMKFGGIYAAEIGRRQVATGDKCHFDEVVIPIRGEKHWLWRAVDQNGVALDILVQSRRDAKAARRLLRKLMKRQSRVPRVMVTDKLRSHSAAARPIMPDVEHRQHKGLNNRPENSHQPTRRRERIMKRFESPGQAQRFLATHDQVANLVRTPTNATADRRRQRNTMLIRLGGRRQGRCRITRSRKMVLFNLAVAS